MEPTVQLDPERCVLVLGSQLAASVLSLAEGVSTVLSYAVLVEVGVQKMFELQGIDNAEEKARKQSLLLSAYELDPAFAATKIVECLREHGLYQKWLEQLFGSLLNLPSQKKPGGVVERLRSLQEEGALLVYSYYDTILDTALNQLPVLLGDEEAVRGWANRRSPGLLHVHGTYTNPDSVSYDSVNYRKLVGESKGGHLLKEACRNRSIIFIGFDGEFYDPFINKFAKTFLSPSHPPPILVSCGPKPLSLGAFLSLKVSQVDNLEKVILSSSPLPRLGPRDTVENKISTSLLYANKTSCLDAAERVKVTSRISVHQLTMRHHEHYHQLLLYLDSEGLKELWKVLFSPPSPSEAGTFAGLQSGLLGVMIDNTAVWLKRSIPVGNTASSIPSPMETVQGLQEHISLTSSSSSSSSTTSHSSPHPVVVPPSLSANVSVISSMWAPIASPSVSKTPPAATSTRPTLPSPLISSTCRTPIGGVATKGLGENLLTPFSTRQHPHHSHQQHHHHHHHRPHGQVRRAQSELDRLSYQDRLTKQAFNKRNGMLLHTESAPNFGYTSEGLVFPLDQHHHTSAAVAAAAAAAAAARTTSNHRSSTSTNRDGSQLEVKIECVDQLRRENAVAGGGSSVPAGAVDASKEWHMPNGSSSKHGPVMAVKGFAEEKQKFISEAQSWSKQVESEIARRVKIATSTLSSSLSSSSSISQLNLSSSSPSSLSSSSTSLPLGLFSSRAVSSTGNQSLLSSKVSQEEQEKFLRQHFEQIQQQQQQQQPNTLSISSLPKLPISSLSISTTQQHPGHAHSPHPSPNLATLQGSHVGGGPSPKKSPINPFLQTSIGVIPFLSQAAALQSPAASGFLCNPQFPAAAMFNPIYQAALQQLMSQQVKGGKPLLITDPATLGLADKIPMVLPDGTVTLVSTPTAAAAAAVAATAAEVKDESTLKSPDISKSQQVGHKRMCSPDDDFRSEVNRVNPPKRRRSNSLPDIAQLSHITMMHNSTKSEEIKEEDDSSSVGVAAATTIIPVMTSSENRPRQLAPPTMIHIPQDLKGNDPMLGFPTPPQSSPLMGNFTLSPIVLSTGNPHTHHHQPMTPVTPNQDSLGDEMRDMMETGGIQTALPPSPEGSNLPPFPAGRGPIQLWQFLLDLLLSPDKRHMIHWTGNGYEFRILQPEEIAKLWGARKNKPRMNYDKLSRGLRYYYSKGIMDKVQGKKLTFKYMCDVQNYVRSRGSHSSLTSHGMEYCPSSGNSTPVPPQGGQGSNNNSVEVTGEDDLGGDVTDGSSKSFSELDLVSHGFHQSTKVNKMLSGVMGVVQGFDNGGGGVRRESDGEGGSDGELSSGTPA